MTWEQIIRAARATFLFGLGTWIIITQNQSALGGGHSDSGLLIVAATVMGVPIALEIDRARRKSNGDGEGQ